MIQDDPYLFFIEGEEETLDDLFFALNRNLVAYSNLLEQAYIKVSRQNFHFRFVGVVVVGQMVLCILPKYYSDVKGSAQSPIIEFVKIMAVLKRAGITESSLPDYINLSYNDERFSELVLSDMILSSYLVNGIFNKTSQIKVLDGAGDIDWINTIESLDPIYVNGMPIYYEFFSSEISLETTHIISEIHKFFIHRALHRFGRLLDYDFILDFEVASELSDLGDEEYLISLLTNELGVTYVDHQILLLKRLINLIQSTSQRYTEGFLLYGTGYFHVIWEKACGILLNNQLRRYQHVLSFPEFRNFTGAYVATESLRPDILTETTSNLDILLSDAKYYLITFNADPYDVYGNPGLADISKQFLYQKNLEEKLQREVYNCFLFPKIQNVPWDILGFISFELFPGKRIFNIYLDANAAFKSYLTNQSLTVSEIDFLLRDIRANM